jgi:hypothetical protein
MKTLHIAIALYIISLASIFIGASVAKADELPKEMTLITVSGEVVLTINPCKVDNNHGFAYDAYATDGDVKHNGCWFKDHDIVNILFYDEPVKLVATFKDYLFKARAK